MESLQEKAIIESLYSLYCDNVILERLLSRMLDFNKLSERTLFLIWYAHGRDEEIVQKISLQYIKNGWWYNNCRECGEYRSENERCSCGFFPSDVACECEVRYCTCIEDELEALCLEQSDSDEDDTLREINPINFTK